MHIFYLIRQKYLCNFYRILLVAKRYRCRVGGKSLELGKIKKRNDFNKISVLLHFGTNLVIVFRVTRGTFAQAVAVYF